eukprot:CAMPEP_0173082820 /NCGR_PEP_ID=MMETSP1102-20130122/18792_1 /TAXON_ID=49646 /ORGANISM="Geminigera sp., Strain Caron Lab Isolate" /LENGTH=121 /DNA_ID=CAMNT_0013959057 /DNA_START=64 /DNA_END=429 /DNA_ORIENTATION=-
MAYFRCAVLALVLSMAVAFSPALLAPRGMALRSTSISRPARVTSLRMADPLYEDNSDEEVAAKVKTASSKSGGVSDGMRAKLLRESQAMGGDPDAPSINFALVFGGLIVALLVLGNLIGAI